MCSKNLLVWNYESMYQLEINWRYECLESYVGSSWAYEFHALCISYSNIYKVINLYLYGLGQHTKDTASKNSEHLVIKIRAPMDHYHVDVENCFFYGNLINT
jgi:hypothetical protein